MFEICLEERALNLLPTVLLLTQALTEDVGSWGNRSGALQSFYLVWEIAEVC